MPECLWDCGDTGEQRAASDERRDELRDAHALLRALADVYSRRAASGLLLALSPDEPCLAYHYSVLQMRH